MRFLFQEFDSSFFRVRDDGFTQRRSIFRIDEEESLGDSYSYLDSTDSDIVAEFVGALKAYDLGAIQEWEQID